jgi:hypothetical protein
MGITFTDCVRLATGGIRLRGAALQSGLELLFGKAIPDNVAPALRGKSSMVRSRGEESRILLDRVASFS